MNLSGINREVMRNGAPERIRTFDRSVRSRVLYPAELRVPCVFNFPNVNSQHPNPRVEDLNGAPERIRTSDRSVRSRVLYPAELRVQN